VKPKSPITNTIVYKRQKLSDDITLYNVLLKVVMANRIEKVNNSEARKIRDVIRKI